MDNLTKESSALFASLSVGGLISGDFTVGGLLFGSFPVAIATVRLPFGLCCLLPKAIPALVSLSPAAFIA